MNANVAKLLAIVILTFVFTLFIGALIFRGGISIERRCESFGGAYQSAHNYEGGACYMDDGTIVIL